MRGPSKLPLLLAAVSLLAVGIAACGGGSSPTTTTVGPSGSQGGAGAAGTAKDGSGAGGSTAAHGGGSKTAQDGGSNAAQGAGSSGSGDRPGEAGSGEPSGSESGSDGGSAQAPSDSGGEAVQFRVPGGDNSIQEFGGEASGSELEQAAAALHAFLEARAGEEWAQACSYMTQEAQRTIEQLGSNSKQLEGKGCAAVLGALSAGLPASAREESTEADVGALRIEGDRAFLLYHGARDTDYAIPMGSEGGGWKVASIAATPLS